MSDIETIKQINKAAARKLGARTVRGEYSAKGYDVFLGGEHRIARCFVGGAGLAVSRAACIRDCRKVANENRVDFKGVKEI